MTIIRLTTIFSTQDFVLNKKDYLLSQVGNPEGADKPNKKVSNMQSLLHTPVTDFKHSSTTRVSGFVRARRPCLSASRRLAPILATPVSHRTSTVNDAKSIYRFRSFVNARYIRANQRGRRRSQCNRCVSHDVVFV